MPDPIAPVEPVAPVEPKPQEPVEPAKDETDWKAEARKWESRAKENAIAAGKLTALEEAQKTEAQRLEERASTAEKLAADNASDALRARVALEKGLTAAQEKRLVGSTREELLADADELLTDLGKPAPKNPAADPSQGPKPAVGPQSPAAEFADIISKFTGASAT